MFMGVQRRSLKAHVKAHRATDAALRLVLHAFRTREPVVGVVVGIHERDTVLAGKADIFLLAQQIFLQRMDIGIVEKDRVVDPRFEERLHQLTRTWRAARVHQQLVAAIR